MCKHCAKNGPLMIAGEKLSTYLEADSAKKAWTLKFCADLEAKLMVILSRRLRSDAMELLDANSIAPEVMADHLIKDIGLDFDYGNELRDVVYRGLRAQVKGILADAIAWEAIFKVENGKDLNLFQWRVGFILNDMTTVENAKKYIMTKRAEEPRIHQERVSLAQSARPPFITTTDLAPSMCTIQSTISAAEGFQEALDSLFASHSSLDLRPTPAGTAANPITLDTDEGPSRNTHAHAPRVSSPLATVHPYAAADLAAQPSAVPHRRPERGFYESIANVTALGNHQSAAPPSKRCTSSLSARCAWPLLRRRGHRAHAR